MKKPLLTAMRLRELLSYDPETGVFTRLVKAAQRVRVGDIAGHKAPTGYWVIKIDNVSYRAHRLAWFYMTEAWPAADIDHIDGNKANNRIANLRDVTRSVNVQNAKRARSSNKSGFLGVSQHESGFQAAIRTENGKRHYLGTYQTPELAHAAYLSAKRVMHEGCTI